MNLQAFLFDRELRTLFKGRYGWYGRDYISSRVALVCFVVYLLLFVKNRRGFTFQVKTGCKLDFAGRNSMTSPRQHIFGLGLTLEASGDAAHRNDDGLGLFSNIYDAGVDCGDTDPECPGTESVSFNQNTDINSQIQPFITNETPQLPFSSPQDIQQQPAIRSESPRSPFNNSLDIQQHPVSGNEPPMSPFTKFPDIQQQPVIRNESAKFPFNNSWSIQQQPFTGNVGHSTATHHNKGDARYSTAAL